MKELTDKVKGFVKERKKQIKGFALVFLIILAVSLVTYLILLGTGVLGYNEEGKLFFDADLFDDYKDRWYGVLLIIALQTVLTMLLCFIPGISMAFIMLINTIYSGNTTTAFFISFVSVMISSSVLYVLGRFGGYKLCMKLLGEEDTEKALTLLRNNGTVYFPLMMMFPIFPDDALTMVAGTIKMKLAWFVPSIVVGRGIGVASIIFGMAAFLPAMEKTYDWFILITILAFCIVIILYLANKLNKLMADKREGRYKPFNIREVGKDTWFALVVSVIVVALEVGLAFIPTLTPHIDSLYLRFEYIVINAFWALVAFLSARAVYRTYKRREKYGYTPIRRTRPTKATIIPMAVTFGVVAIATPIGAALHFFPTMHHPYEWFVIITAYIIWSIAIYMITEMISGKIRKLSAKKKKSQANGTK